MSVKVELTTKWRDPADGNVYSVEKSIKTGKFVVIRTNPGGNRKRAKQFSVAGTAPAVSDLLNATALQAGWEEVPL